MNRSKSRILAALVLALAVVPGGAEGADDKDAEALLEQREGRKPESDEALKFWLENMVWYHGFSVDEITAATGLSAEEVEAALARFKIDESTRPAQDEGGFLTVMPYPGGRHPRIGFLDGAIRPQRETKISVFAPWDPRAYVVVDVPEAIRWQHGILYLAHTHVPTAWTERGVTLPRLEWIRRTDGGLESARALPNGVTFGAEIEARKDHVRMRLWLENGSDEELKEMRIQNCAMLKGMPGFDLLTKDNKVLSSPFAACRNEEGTRWIIMAWSPCLKPWANPPVPCLHSDPKFPDCPPGERREVRGWLSFFEGRDIEAEFRRIDATGWREGIDE